MDHGIMIAAFLSLSTLISFSKAVLGLGIVIFVHELGHFLVAKACGVKCEKFYVGFDAPIKIFGIALPRTLFKKKWGETEYGIGIIPLGGYVKMLGQDDNPANAAAEAARIRAEGGHVDPRSYPAKSVPQRMAIISAGVIFNLMFGVVFAAVAYRMGVEYTPLVIGSAGVGDPAWNQGIQPGERIVSIRKNQSETQFLRFQEDLKVHMLSLDKDDVVNLRVEDLDGNVRSVTITPSSAYKKLVRSPALGVSMTVTPRVDKVVIDSVAGRAGLKPDDKIHAVTVDQERIEIDPDGIGIDFVRVRATNSNKPMTLHVTRVDEKTKESTNHDIELEVSRGKRLGIELSMGPIVCIQSGSIAEQAGLKVGDVVTHLDGQTIGDPLTLPLRLLDHIGKTTKITVARGDTEENIQLTPRAPRTGYHPRRRNGAIALDTLGLGYVIHPTVTGVVPGSPSAEAGIQAGDELTSVQLVYHPEPIPEKDRLPSIFGNWQAYRHKSNGRRLMEAYELDKPLPIDKDNNNWPYLIGRVNEFDFEVTVNYQRDGIEKSATMTPAESDSIVDSFRGFYLAGYKETRTAETWSEAFQLGVREVWEGTRQVLVVLKTISSNVGNLGGPLTIAAVATSQASEGLPRLLIFLTLLSANLAVLNFLPIPVLDGGHMLFLAYEGVAGKPVNERIQMSLTLLGAGMLLCLMLFVLGLDLFRFLG